MKAPIVLIILALVLWSVARFGSTTLEQDVTLLLNRNLCTNQWNAPIQSALEFFLAGTKYAEHWQINRSPLRNHINVYVLAPELSPGDRRVPPRIARVLGTCAFAGDPQIIVCDSSFFESFLSRWQTHLPKSLVDRDREVLPTWVLGHELGHLLLGHRPAHFEPGSLEIEKPNVSLDHERELEADQFCVTALARDRKLEQQVRLLLYDVLDAEITLRVGNPVYGVGLRYDYDAPDMIEYTSEGTHPEYVLRTTRMLLRLGDLEGNEGLKNEVTLFAQRLRESDNSATPHVRFFDVRGCVLDTGGQPVSNASVRLIPSVQKLGETLPTAGTDATGRFEFVHLDGQIDYRLLATDSAHGFAQLELLRRVDKRSSYADVTIQLSPTGTLAGHVMDKAGQGVADARVELDRTIPFDVKRSVVFSELVAVTTTDRLGQFVFGEVIPRTEHKIWVSCQGYDSISSDDTSIPVVTVQAGEKRVWPPFVMTRESE